MFTKQNYGPWTFLPMDINLVITTCQQKLHYNYRLLHIVVRVIRGNIPGKFFKQSSGYPLNTSDLHGWYEWIPTCRRVAQTWDVDPVAPLKYTAGSEDNSCLFLLKSKADFYVFRNYTMIHEGCGFYYLMTVFLNSQTE